VEMHHHQLLNYIMYNTPRLLGFKRALKYF
jgi:hypothetical protein